jgi:chromosome partitioning protein
VLIVLANLKGGVGKTTSAVHLSCISKRDRPTTLIDSDSQASASEWVESLTPELRPTLIEAPSARTLRQALDKPREGLTIVDTPPGGSEIVLAALERADMVVIPSRAGTLEIPRVAVTLSLIPGGIPHSILLCACNQRTRAHKETVAAWQEAGVQIAGEISARVAVTANLDLDPQALAEYDRVLHTLLTQHSTT